MDFLILNRGQAKFIKPDPETRVLVLSVREINRPEPDFDFIEESNILRMVFTDEDSIEEARRIGQEHLVFTRDQALSIFSFLKKKKDLDLVICQCDGGMCRSAAMAAALSVIFNGPGSDLRIFKIKNPNRLVYNIMMEVAHELQLI